MLYFLCQGGKNMANKKIREHAKKRGIPHYLIADELKMQESAFSKMLRKELSSEKRQQVFDVIEKLYRKNQSVSCSKKQKDETKRGKNNANQ